MRQPRRRAYRFSLPSAAPVFAALGDATRLRIVVQLRQQGPQSISQLTTAQLITARLTGHPPISRQAITKHLRSLEQVQLVCSERCGRERRWELRAHKLDELRTYFDQICGHWDQALERLRGMVESP